ncbi:MAG: hypothetical protein U1E05_14380 [Patescibacteria group bacterium]|nr:hypothetical protein [Patescibacteria group bacterium]
MLVKDAEQVQGRVAVDVVVEQAAHRPVAEVRAAAGVDGDRLR